MSLSIGHPPDYSAASQAVEPVGDKLLPRPNANAGPQPVELDAKLQQASSSSAETLAVYPDEEANNLRHLADLEVITIAGVQLNKHIVHFVQNLRQAKIENDVLTLPGGALLGGIPDLHCLGGKMLVRQCYRELKNQMMKRSEAQLLARVYPDDFVIMGNPGIGKSLFTYYMLYVLMHLKKTIVWQPLGSTEVVCITATTISFADDIDEFADHLENASTWYIVDGQPPEMYPAITLLVTSPDRNIWKKFAKERTLIRYMPIWSDAEIKMVKPRGMAFAQSESRVQELEDWVIEEQYRIWGGIPRYVFQRALEIGVNELMEEAINDMKVESLYRYDGVTDGHDSRHHVMHMIVTINCAEDHCYLNYVMGFASDYARDLVLSRSLSLNHEKVEEFITTACGESTAAVFHGVLFEAYWHTFLCSRREFMVRKLDGTAPNVQKPFPVDFGKGTNMKLKEFDDVSKIQDPEDWKDYFKPTSKNYKSIDSLMFPGCLFKMANGYPIRSTGLKEVVDEMLTRRKCALSPEDENFRLYFVVPEDKFVSFKRQEYEGEEPTFPSGVRVDQYALQADLDSKFFGKPRR